MEAFKTHVGFTETGSEMGISELLAFELAHFDLGDPRDFPNHN